MTREQLRREIEETLVDLKDGRHGVLSATAVILVAVDRFERGEVSEADEAAAATGARGVASGQGRPGSPLRIGAEALGARPEAHAGHAAGPG